MTKYAPVTNKNSYYCIFSEAHPSEARVLASIIKLKFRLSDMIEPDFGLLDRLLSLEVLTFREYQDVRREEGAPYKRSEAILNLLMSEDKCVKFLNVLEDTSQKHVVNFISQDGGEKRCDFYHAILIANEKRCTLSVRGVRAQRGLVWGFNPH